jgi:hypothetical protein
MNIALGEWNEITRGLERQFDLLVKIKLQPPKFRCIGLAEHFKIDRAVR